MSDLEETFNLLRVNLTTSAAPPSVITVTAAAAEDNTAYVAAGIARAYAERGASVLFVDGKRSAASDMAPVAIDGEPNLDLVELHPSVASRRGTLADSIAAYREQYDLVVIDAGSMPSSAALEFAHNSDAIVLAIRLGRRGGRSDQTMLRSLGADREAKVVAVVPTRPGARSHLETAPRRARTNRLPSPFPRFPAQSVELGR